MFYITVQNLEFNLNCKKKKNQTFMLLKTNKKSYGKW